MTPALLSLLIAGLIGLGTLFIGLILTEWLTASADRFATELEAEPPQREKAARIIRALGTTFASLARPFHSIIDDLEEKLTHAGRPYGGVNGQQYLAAAMVLGVLIGAGVALFMTLNGLMTGKLASEALSGGLRWWFFIGAGAVVFLILDIHGNATRNSDEIEREFPFFLDLAILVVQAGGTPRKALAKYVEASPGTALAKEIAITAKDADSTSFDEALHRMATRTRAVSVKTILKNLAQGEKSSGEAEQFYTAQAEELRFLREEMASRTAERLKTNITMPVFLMLMSIILAALALTIVSIGNQGFF